MKNLLSLLFLVVTHVTFGQNLKSGPDFDVYKDFENYALGKESKYQRIYDAYSRKDSIPNYVKMTKKAEEYPAPCYKLIGDGTVQISTDYTCFFLLQTLMNRYSCSKDGSSWISRKNYWNDNRGRLDDKILKEAIKLLEQNTRKNFTQKELDAFFEEAKIHFRKGDYEKANTLFAFLATVDEHYREASLNNVGLSYYNKKEYSHALVYFEKAIALYPKGYLGYLNAGACKAKLPVDLGDANQSATYFKMAYELAPNNPNAVFNYANAIDQYSTKGIDNQSLKENLFAKAVQNNGNEPLFKYQYAVSQHKKAQDGAYKEELFNNALNAYSEAVKLFPQYADNYKGKAKLLSSWSRNKSFPQNRSLRDSACSALEKYKSLSKENYDVNLNRLCTSYPKIMGNYIQNYTALLPKGWEQVSLAKGDLNKDGVDDIVLIARATDSGKIQNIIRYNTSNQEKGTRNYNRSSLYVLLGNPQQNNYEIKEVEDNLLEPDESYYDKEYEVQIKNGAFRLIRKESPQTLTLTRIFRLENGKFMMIGLEGINYNDNLGNMGAGQGNHPGNAFHFSYNLNTKALQIDRLNPATKKKELRTYTIQAEKIALSEIENKEWEVRRKIDELIKAFR